MLSRAEFVVAKECLTYIKAGHSLATVKAFCFNVGYKHQLKAEMKVDKRFGTTLKLRLIHPTKYGGATQIRKGISKSGRALMSPSAGSSLNLAEEFSSKEEDDSFIDREVEVVIVSQRQLGFSNKKRNRKQNDRITYANIYARAKSLGLESCGYEVGFALLIQYAEQPLGECLHVGSFSPGFAAQVPDYDEEDRVCGYNWVNCQFTLSRRKKDRILDASPIGSHWEFRVDRSVKFAFVLPHKGN